MSQTAFAAPAALSTSAFSPKTSVSRCHNNRRRHVVYTARPRRANLTMVSQTNLAKKSAKVESMKERLSKCKMIVSTPLDGLTVAQIMDLKKRLPASTTVGTVKNTLMRRAIAESEWEVAGELTTKSSMWFFIEEDMKGTIKAYESFSKELSRDAIRGGVFEGTFYDTKGIESIAALPSKKELITKIAVSVKMVPTKLARSVNAVPAKMARAIKLAVADDGDGESSES